MNDSLLIPDQAKIGEANDFLKGFSSVVMATVSIDGQPHSSYAPFIADSGNFYVYVSSLAQHTATLKNGFASLFFIEDEQSAKNIFARRRLTVDCRSAEVAQQSPDFSRLLDIMEKKHGSTVGLLRSLPDFTLFELTPERTRFVTGFGAAYEMDKRLIIQTSL